MKFSTLSLLALSLTIATPALAGGGGSGNGCTPAGKQALRTQAVPKQVLTIQGQGEISFSRCSGGGRFDLVSIRTSIQRSGNSTPQKMTKEAKAALAYVNEVGQPVVLFLLVTPEIDGSATIRTVDAGLVKALESRRGVTLNIQDLAGFAQGEILLSL